MAASRRLALLATLVLGTLCACSPGGATATTTSETTSTAIATTTSSTPDTATTTTPAQSTTIPAEETVQVLLQPFSEMGGAWSELFLTYGEAEDQIGTAPGGDGVMLGPEYGTQTPDGNWWILDAAKQRAAVYTEDGSYQDQVPFPEEVLVDGRYFQYQMPQALDDGSIAATGFRGEDSTSLLRIIDGKVTSITFEGSIPWVTTDGTYLYGLGEDAAPYRLDVANPPGRRVANLVTRCGTHYRIAVQGDEIVIDNFPYLG